MRIFVGRELGFRFLAFIGFDGIRIWRNVLNSEKFKQEAETIEKVLRSLRVEERCGDPIHERWFYPMGSIPGLQF